MTVADLRGAHRSRPRASKFFQFHAGFGRIWQNCVFTPPEGSCPHLGEILDPSLNEQNSMLNTCLYR